MKYIDDILADRIEVSKMDRNLLAILQQTEQSDGLEKVRLLKRAIELTKEKNEISAILHVELGDALEQLEDPYNKEKQQVTEEAYLTALEFFERTKYPTEWAQMAVRLGTFYLFLPSVNARENLEMAIVYLGAALQLLSREEHYASWKIAQNNIALAYFNRIEGPRTTNIGKAIKYNEAFLAVIDKNEEPYLWAQVKNNLASAFLYRGENSTSEDQENALQIYKDILHIYSRADFPVEWAKTNANLSIIYRDRIEGDPSQNLEAGLDTCKAALEVFTRAQFPEDWARNKLHLGNIYIKRRVGVPRQNIEEALLAYKAALEVFTKGGTPVFWGMVQIALGIAFHTRVAGERGENFEGAVAAYRAALEVFTLKGFPDLYARAQNNLGNVYKDRGGMLEANIENAIACYKSALLVYTKDQYPYRWAMAQNNLASAFLARSADEKSENLQTALHLYKAALEVRTREKFPEDHLSTMRNLGETYYALGSWKDALYHFQQAIDTAEALRNLAGNLVSHSKLSGNMAPYYRMAIHSSLMLGQVENAATLTVNSKGRTLASQMNAIDRKETETVTTSPELTEILKTLRTLENKIISQNIKLRSLESSLGSGAGEAAGSTYEKEVDVLERLRAQRMEMIDRMAVDHPALSGVHYSAPMKPTGIREAIAATGDLPVIDFVQHEAGWGAFVYREKKLSYCALDIDLYDKIIETLMLMVGNKLWGRSDAGIRLQDLYHHVFEPLQGYLPPNGRLLICPTGILHLVPFHALVDKAGEYLTGSYAFRFIPSLTILPILLRNMKQNEDQSADGARLLNIAHPGQRGERNYMPGEVQDEMDAVGDCFPPEPQQVKLFEEKARPAVVLQLANTVPWDVIHINCHGIFNFDDPIRSGLLLQAGFLAIQDILLRMRLRGRPLVTLSACQTGQLRPETADENMSFTSAFLIAGAAVTLTSLWSVPAASTMLLMKKFYTIRKKRLSSDEEALQEAIREIRSMEGYNSPLYWAAFQLTGIGEIRC